MNKAITRVGILVTTSFLLAGCTKPGTPPQTTTQAVNEATEFAQAIESGKPTVCTLTKDKDVMEYELKDKKMRIKTTTTLIDDKGVTSTKVANMINDTAFFYMWDDATKQGTKMAVPSKEEAQAIADKAKQAPQFSPAPKLEGESDYQNFKNEGYSINCQASSLNDSVFTPPSDVKFIDPTEMMKAIPSPAANGQIDMKKIQELQKQYGGE